MSRDEFRKSLANLIPHLPPPVQEIEVGTQHHQVPPQVQGVPQEAPQVVLPDPLPDFKKMSEIVEGQIELPKLLVHGLLHEGCKMVLAGGSKSFKSWSLIDLGLSICNGLEWWGNRCEKGRVLYINFELIEGFFEQRLMTISKAKGVQMTDDFIYWSLRGKCYELDVLTKILTARAQHMGKIDLIIVDPIYKALGHYDENSAGDMGHLMNEVEKLASTLKAAVVFGAHFSKGSQNHKNAIDRVAGSGVFARDPDAILTMTGHEDQGSYIVESELRYLAPLPPFVTTWNYPLMIPDESKDPTAFYDPNKRAKKEKEEDAFTSFSKDDCLNVLPHSGLQDPAWKTIILQQFGKAGKAFYEYKAELIEEGEVIKKNGRFYPANLTLASD